MGCRFHTRCPLVVDKCRTIDPEIIAIEPGHRVACHLVTEGIFRYVAIDENGRPRHIPDNPQFFTRSGGTWPSAKVQLPLPAVTA